MSDSKLHRSYVHRVEIKVYKFRLSSKLRKLYELKSCTKNLRCSVQLDPGPFFHWIPVHPKV